ncbi:retrovirus-related pol polyprotein from transposon TNT 1-94 [Tanacetum coccineum]|uniref:Retrovirus-related pol polyprotein from transposon TNT 1-94 n=1 Tax=Tanacetum coccineum TaxID=301880 RepID=A0ABQ5HPF4_9ASTR
MITKRGRRLQRYDLQLIMCGNIVKDSNSYLKSKGSIEDFVSFREMITSQLQGKLWLYDEVRWVDKMQEYLNQFYRNNVWTLVPLPYGKISIGSKWEEGIDYDETFAPVARMEAIRIFLSFSTYMNFIVFQIDVKSAFRNKKLKEEVYVKQPPGFKINEFPDYVCKLDKALYRLKQAPRAWYMKGTPSLGLCAKKQQSVAISSTKAEYVVNAGCCVKILWMKSQLSDYGIDYKMVPIFCDNTSAIAISNNSVLHSTTKYIDIRYHLIRDHILKGGIELLFIPTDYQVADIFTKPLDEPTFTRLKAELDILNID